MCPSVVVLIASDLLLICLLSVILIARSNDCLASVSTVYVLDGVYLLTVIWTDFHGIFEICVCCHYTLPDIFGVNSELLFCLSDVNGRLYRSLIRDLANAVPSFPYGALEISSELFHFA